MSEQQEEPRNVLISSEGEGTLFLSCHPAVVLDLLRRAAVLVVILLRSCQLEDELCNRGGLLGLVLTRRDSPM